MSIINSQPRIGAAGQSTGQYKIERGLRFNSADSAYLNRTFASNPTTRTKCHWHWIIKRGTLGTVQRMFGGYSGTSGDSTWLSFDATDTDKFKFNVGGSNGTLTSNAVFRDPSAWYICDLAFDSTQSTAADRAKFWVNGVLQTWASGTVTSNSNHEFAMANGNNQIGSDWNPSLYFNGYMAEVHWIDGSAKTPSDFGETDTDTGVWKPKAYSGSYGTNGFYLKFADNSGTTSTTLGKDSSGNGNNWTPNNFYVGPGTTNAEKAGIDSLVDTPTPYGTDTGAGGEVRGNYCTLNPVNGSGTIANGNLDHRATTTTWVNAPGTILVTSGKWYWESTAVGSSYKMIGIATSAASKSTDYGSPTETWTYREDATKFGGGNAGVSYGATFADGDVIGVALDMDAGTLVFYKNGVSQGTAFNTGISGKTIGPWVGAYNSNVGTNNNFGQRPFAYTAPSGFKALCTQNLPTPTIGATSTTQAGKYFNTVTYSGTGATQSITSVGFQPDFIWFKRIDAAASHALNDSVRGVTKSLTSNGTDSEYTSSSGNDLVSFNSTGFTVGPTEIWNSYNVSGGSLVAWNWKANGAGSSNNAGSIQSTVSANTTAGFSIVTYTGNGTSGATVGHGCLVNGAATTPEMLIFKNRDATDGWIVFQKYVGGTDDWWDTRLLLASTAARADNAGYLTAAPTSTLLTLSNTSPVNTSSQKYLVYCFAPVAGYSAFGSYTGNGSADGPFVYTGFMPRYIMIKRTDTSGTSWVIFDTARNLFNSSGKALWADLSDAEATYTDFDILSNGFKLRFTSSTGNASGGTYVYAAFAESPFKYSLAR